RPLLTRVIAPGQGGHRRGAPPHPRRAARGDAGRAVPAGRGSTAARAGTGDAAPGGAAGGPLIRPEDDPGNGRTATEVDPARDQDWVGRRMCWDAHAARPSCLARGNASLPSCPGASGNAASRDHPFARFAEQAVDNAREQMAALIGASGKEFIFPSAATESNNL